MPTIVRGPWPAHLVIAAEPPKANLVELSGNFLIAAVIETLGEAFALVSKAGIDRAGYLEILTNTLFAATVYKTYGGMIAEQRYAPPGFEAMLGFKDIHLALGAAEALRVPMPVASLLRDRRWLSKELSQRQRNSLRALKEWSHAR